MAEHIGAVEALGGAPELDTALDTEPACHVEREHGRAHDRVGVLADHDLVDAGRVPPPRGLSRNDAHAVEHASHAEFAHLQCDCSEQGRNSGDKLCKGLCKGL